MEAHHSGHHLVGSKRDVMRQIAFGATAVRQACTALTTVGRAFSHIAFPRSRYPCPIVQSLHRRFDTMLLKTLSSNEIGLEESAF